eukprot:RCo021169
MGCICTHDVSRYAAPSPSMEGQLSGPEKDRKISAAAGRTLPVPRHTGAILTSADVVQCLSILRPGKGCACDILKNARVCYQPPRMLDPYFSGPSIVLLQERTKALLQCKGVTAEELGCLAVQLSENAKTDGITEQDLKITVKHWKRAHLALNVFQVPPA